MKFYLPATLAAISSVASADAYLFPSPFSPLVVLSKKNSPSSMWREADHMIERMDKMFESDQNSLVNRMNKMFDDDSWTLADRMVDRMDEMLKLPRASPFYKITNDDEVFQVTVDLPGVKASDIDISVDNEHDMLSLRGEGKKEDENMISTFKFSQRFSLDPSIEREKITAGLKDGVLTVSAPKKLPQLDAGQTKIPVTVMESTNEEMTAAEPTNEKTGPDIEGEEATPEMKKENPVDPAQPVTENVAVKQE
mmetsp:Transcript_13162/g.15836  ORF Transcript_13162/g.15836 Transcript_13162/m.15836 type:complete len:252 (+) Transcript_13162:92-847(+)